MFSPFRLLEVSVGSLSIIKHETLAFHPVEVTKLSEINRSVSLPAEFVAFIVPGEFPPIKLPITGALVLAPS
jgi:hypothetical protein